MKFISLVFSCLLLVTLSFGQQRPDQSTNRVASLKIAYITEKLNLTESEAEKFWPIYRKYDSEIKDVRQQQTKDQSDVLGSEEKLLKIKKKYQSEFKKALSDEKINHFFKVEKDFNTQVQNEFKKRIQNRHDAPRTSEIRKGGRS